MQSTIKSGQSCLLTRAYLALPKTQPGYRTCQASFPGPKSRILLVCPRAPSIEPGRCGGTAAKVSKSGVCGAAIGYDLLGKKLTKGLWSWSCCVHTQICLGWEAGVFSHSEPAALYSQLCFLIQVQQVCFCVLSHRSFPSPTPCST